MGKSKKKTEETKSEAKELLEWFLYIGIPACLLFIVLHFFIGIVKVNGDSMNDTYKHNQTLIMNRIAQDYQVGDVIVCRSEDYPEIIIKRIVAVGGDVIDCSAENGFTVNGAPVILNGASVIGDTRPFSKEEHAEAEPVQFPITVPEHTYFVLGDNRENSVDSRDERVGCIKEENILGVVLGKKGHTK